MTRVICNQQVSQYLRNYIKGAEKSTMEIGVYDTSFFLLVLYSPLAPSGLCQPTTAIVASETSCYSFNVKWTDRQLEGNLENIAGGESSRSGSFHESFYQNINIINNKKSWMFHVYT